MSKKNMVVAPDQMPGMFKRLGRIMAEIWKQALRGLQEPGKGLSLDQLQLFVEHRDPFAKVKTTKPRSGSRYIVGYVPGSEYQGVGRR